MRKTEWKVDEDKKKIKLEMKNDVKRDRLNKEKTERRDEERRGLVDRIEGGR